MNLLLLGLAIGLAIVKFAWPHMVASDDIHGDGPATTQHGNWAAVDAGFVLAGVGQLSAFSWR